MSGLSGVAEGYIGWYFTAMYCLVFHRDILAGI